MRVTLASVSLGILLPHLGLGQATAIQRTFETADVRTSAPGTRQEGGFLPGGRFERRGATMARLIADAYGVNADLVLGEPGWLGSDRFDVTAAAPPGAASPEILRRMLQALLADRFGLAVHNERKNMPVYVLAVGKKGPKVQASAGQIDPDCPRVDGVPGMNHRACHAFTMADLSRLLPQVARNYVDRPVVDMTGLEGPYDFPLDWMDKGAFLAAKAHADGPAPVSLFDALDKLGLKLEQATRPVAVIVIDHVNRPQADDSRAAAREDSDLPAEFDAAEILPSKPGETEMLTAQNGRLEILSYTLRKLITIAFNVKDDMVTGGPKWLDADRFDVIAKSPEAMSPHAMSQMLKALIVQRFSLKTHHEDQPVQVFALVLGKGSQRLNQTGGSALSGCRLTPAKTGRALVCRNTTMAQLAERLPDVAQAYLTHPLVDLTGLKGAYDFTLTWTARARLAGAADKGDDTVQPAEGDLTIFEAIDKQLGLRLDERKHSMPVIVIDHVERTPS